MSNRYSPLHLRLTTLALLVAGCASKHAPAPVADAGVSHDLGPKAPVMLAPATTLTRCLAIDATHAYWSDSSSGAPQILSAPLTGGVAPTVVAAGGDAKSCVATDGSGHVFYVADGGTSIMRAGAGDAPTQLVGGTNAKTEQLVLGNGNVYWISDTYGDADAFSGHPAIVSVPAGGGDVSLVSDVIMGTNWGDLAFDGSSFYYADGTGLFSLPAANPTTPTAFMTQASFKPSPFVYGSNVIAVSEVIGLGGGSSTGDLAVFHSDGSHRTVIASSVVSPLAVDELGVYVNQGNLTRIAFDGTATVLATQTPSAVALGNGEIYFLDGAGLWALAR